MIYCMFLTDLSGSYVETRLSRGKSGWQEE